MRNLQSIFDNISVTYFPHLIKPSLQTFRSRTTSKSKSVTFAYFDSEAYTIRVNTLLLNYNIPEFFVEYIIYHEFCHIEQFREQNGKRLGIRYHTPDFIKKEERFPRFKEAERFSQVTFWKEVVHRV